MSDIRELAKKLRSLEDSLVNCNRCGFCQATCAVYGQTKVEGDVSRGKLALLTNLSQEILNDVDSVEERLSRCLLCGACKHTCPSGVPTFDIFLKAREIIYAYKGLSPIKKLIFRSILPHPGLQKFFMCMGAPFMGIFMPKDKNPQNTATAPLLSGLIGKRHLPVVKGTTLSSKVGRLDTKPGKSGIKVAFFPGCMGDKAYIDMAEACLKVFDHHGVGVFMPDNLVCCGLPALTSGDTTAFTKLARLNIQALSQGEFDYIITPCPSCTVSIRDLWLQYAKDLSFEESHALRKFAPKAMDINQFIVNVLHAATPAPTKSDAKTITYHDSCHLRLSLACTKEPRDLIATNGNYKLVEMAESDRCCGCGGSFTLTQPKLSEGIGQRKVDNILATKADVVAAGCPACMMQISDMLARNGASAQVKHSVEIYAETL